MMIFLIDFGWRKGDFFQTITFVQWFVLSKSKFKSKRVSFRKLESKTEVGLLTASCNIARVMLSPKLNTDCSKTRINFLNIPTNKVFPQKYV